MGQSLEDQISSLPASVTVSTTDFGPRSALQSLADPLVATILNVGFSPGA